MSLALIAGEGALPVSLVRALEAEARLFRLCELEDHPSQARGNRPVLRFRVETLGSFIAELKQLGVTEVCFAGRIARPALDPSRLDPATMPLVPRMMAALQLGDDAALRIVLSFFEEAGLQIVAAHEIVPDLRPDRGMLTEAQPTDQDIKDAERGVEVIRALATADLGQACVISHGQALAVETIAGTDWMMRSLLSRQVTPAAFDDDESPDGLLSWAAQWLIDEADRGDAYDDRREPDLPKGGILIKAAKPGQDMRIDVPTIGPKTILRASEVGLRGVVIEADTVMVLERDTCVEIANRNDLFIWVRS